MRRRRLSNLERASIRQGALLLGTIAAALIVLSTIGASVAQLLASDPNIVRIDAGAVQGKTETDVVAFKGIPFAQPPVGALRWRPPQPVEAWSGVLDARQFRPDCMQPNPSAARARMSEDCLYINVWRPTQLGTRPLPVMVWLHGGGLTTGGASLYPGEHLARQGIVVVSFNYRLGRLGFFAHPALARESPRDPRGNYGYMDQIAALQWVQRNIAAFGGDPTQVTIAGGSAGGGSVLIILTSPMARGLFQRAILQSPEIPTSRAGAAPMRELASAESIALEYARSFGVVGEGIGALSALRALPAHELVAATDMYASAIFGGPEIPGLSHSIIDGRLVVDPPELVLRAGRQARVPVIVGANDYDLALSPARTKDALFARFGSHALRARQLYDPNGDRGLPALIQDIMSDFAMVEPSRYLAELVSSAGQPAYFYRFAYVPEFLRDSLPGAPHALDIPFTFDAVTSYLKQQHTDNDREMAKTMSGYWVAFVRNGNPNGAGRPAWPSFDPVTGKVMHFTNQGVAFTEDPLQERLDLWWAVWQRRSNDGRHTKSH